MCRFELHLSMRLKRGILLCIFESGAVGGIYAFLLACGLIAVMMTAVHRAEVVAHRVGEYVSLIA